MIYVIYIIIVVLVVWLSIKASRYIDLIERTTRLSGAFLGGVLLSAVTSLPELFTSISATTLLGKPSLCISNILGSNIFNLAVLAVMIMVCIKGFSKAKIAKGHYYLLLFLTIIYFVLVLNWQLPHIFDYHILNISITSLLIIVFYILSIKHLAGENSEATKSKENVTNFTTKQIIVRFVSVSIAIVVLSVFMTYVTNEIAIRLNLGVGLAGALFLGVATSLPEVSSTITLFNMRNYNMAIGSIVGSNMFNLVILSIADSLCLTCSIYDFSDPKVISLLFFGALSTLVIFIAIRCKNKTARIIFCLTVLGFYLAFLLLKRIY